MNGWIGCTVDGDLEEEDEDFDELAGEDDEMVLVANRMKKERIIDRQYLPSLDSKTFQTEKSRDHLTMVLFYLEGFKSFFSVWSHSHAHYSVYLFLFYFFL